MNNCHISNLTGGFFNQHEIKTDHMTLFTFALMVIGQFFQ